MGGANSGMDDNTTSLLFECATFARDSVRKTSRALGQNSDSSARYEKGVDRHSPELGLARALHLIQELDCGDITTLEYDRPMDVLSSASTSSPPRPRCAACWASPCRTRP